MFAAIDTLPGARPDLAEAFAAAWQLLAGPGARWTGEQRIALAAVARRAWAGESGPDTGLPAAAVEAASTLGGVPGTVRRETVDGWTGAGLDVVAYAELVGVVARTTAVDSFHRAMGLDLEPLPEPVPGEPGGDPMPEGARRTSRSHAPTVGPPTIPSVLSIAPAENEGWMALSDAMYLTFAEMEHPDAVKDLDRTHIELVAARTSLVNECFF
ncbi:MAG: hypothetical protein R3290_03685 [Acidimicrobiia bacterium]|nr:hypothetical protein [Acidimicrobiia bacterium]